MEAFYLHLLKSSGILVLFLAVYHLFLKKDTFFGSNRVFLISGLLISWLLPFLSFTKTVYVEPIAENLTNQTYAISSIGFTETAVSSLDWIALATTLYLVGVAFFLNRLLMQLYSIKTIKQQGQTIKDGPFYHVKTTRNIAPFSFFKHIFYYPYQFSKQELDTILLHEKEHAKGMHSLDILLTEAYCILLWFNPLVWLYRSFIKQNLEYLADIKTCDQLQDATEYQYLMLQQAMGRNQIIVANHFYNSIIKKRIVMLNQNQSNPVKRLKQLLILPLLGLFLVAFNVDTEYKTNISAVETLKNSQETYEYLISKSSQEKELQNIKTKLKDLGIDFSYTTVRNMTGDIIDVDLNLTGIGDDGTQLNVSYITDASEQPIEAITIEYHKKASSLSVKALKSTYTQQNDKKEKESKNVDTQNVSQSQLTNITLEINKTSLLDDLKKDVEFLEQRGVTIKFRGIKRNSDNEITAIKVNYDNGDGDKGNYQQQRTTGIDPFNVIVDFQPGEAATIKVGVIQQSRSLKTVIWNGLDEIGEHDDIVVKKGGTYKTIELTNDGEDQVIILNEKVHTIDSLKNEGKVANHITKVITIDSENENNRDEIQAIRISENDGDRKILKLRTKDSDSILKTFVIISNDSLTDKEAGNSFTIKVDSDYTEDNVFILRSNPSDEDETDINFVTTKGNPMYIIDGKEVSKKDFKKLKPNNIERVNVIKGNAALMKYGNQAKNGVVEVVTKKKNE